MKGIKSEVEELQGLVEVHLEEYLNSQNGAEGVPGGKDLTEGCMKALINVLHLCYSRHFDGSYDMSLFADRVQAVIAKELFESALEDELKVVS